MLRLRAELQVRHLLADSAYAKVKFIEGVTGEVGWDLVSKLRSDADLKYLYTGPRSSGPGRPKKYDGKVFFDDVSRWESLGADEAGVEYFCVVAWGVSFKRKLKVVMVRKRRRDGKVARVLLFSTDTELEGMVEQLGLDPDHEKIAPHLDGLCDYGVLAA